VKGEIMLFDDNLGFITYPFSDSTNMKEKPRLTSVDEGFLKGNMFENLYEPYKNYTYYKIMPKSKREELLLDIISLSFAINDLGLYLDLNPDDTDILKKFRSLVESACEKEMEYVKNYGPLEMIDNDSSKKFNWIKNPWPWDKEDAKYV